MINGINDISKLQTLGDYKEKINDVLVKAGFNKVLYRDKFDADRDYFKELTISIAPQIESYNVDYYSKIQLMELEHTLGFYSYMNYACDYSGEEFAKDEYEKIYYESKKTKKTVVGVYSKERNLVMFGFDFIYNFRFNDIKVDKHTALKFILKLITDCCKEYKVELVKQTKDQEDIIAECFMKYCSTKIKNIDNDMRTWMADMSNKDRQMMSIRKKLILAGESKTAISEFLLNSKKTVIEEIKGIKEFGFVKSVVLDSGNIIVNIGEISIALPDKSLVKIGEIVFTISADRILVDCKPRKKYWSTDYDTWKELIHPHVNGIMNDQSICFGDERREVVYGLLASASLKKLVFMLYLWAKSYNPADKYHAIGYWTGEMGKHPKGELPPVEEVVEEVTEEVTEENNDDRNGLPLTAMGAMGEVLRDIRQYDEEILATPTPTRAVDVTEDDDVVENDAIPREWAYHGVTGRTRAYMDRNGVIHHSAVGFDEVDEDEEEDEDDD